VERMKLLVTDLDGTLLGDDRALDGFAVWYEQVQSQLRLVYSSGRFLESIQESIDEFGLPAPDAVICGVGTEIHDFTTGLQLPGWPEASQDWNSELVREICAEFDELEEQPSQFNSHYKLSYFGHQLDDAFFSRLTRRLDAAGLEVSVIYSSRRDLDIVPATTNKGTAATFLARHWNLAREQVAVAGDSGNDLAMFGVGFRGIVVGNAHPELLSLHAPNVYHARSANAAGVLEGLRHWFGDLWDFESGIPVTAGRSTLAQDAGRGTLE
jgi:sucrose-6F-phosphate phosphohydrolase